MIDDNLKSQIKNGTLHSCRQFPLLPTLFLQYIWSNKFRNFSKIVLMLFYIPGTLSTLNLPLKSHPSTRQLLFFWHNFSIKLSDLQSKGETIKLLTYHLYDRYFIYKTVKTSQFKNTSSWLFLKVYVLFHQKKCTFQNMSAKFVMKNKPFSKNAALPASVF